jgi:hypothetical protein
MAENDTSWFHKDNSWRKTTAHGGAYQKASVVRLPSQVAAKYILKILWMASNIQGRKSRHLLYKKF